MKVIQLHAPAHIYRLPDTNFAEGALLMMVYSFRKKGLALFNERIAQYLDCSEAYVSELLGWLKKKDYIKIEKPKSKYRRIFPTEKMLVLLADIASSEIAPLKERTSSKRRSTQGRGEATRGYDLKYNLTLSNVKKDKEEKSAENHKTLTEPTPEQKLAELLLAQIRERDAGFSQPDIENWSQQIDALIRLDKRDAAQIEAVIRWSQQDSFWHQYILSAENLRKHFSSLVAKMPPGSNTAPLVRDKDGLTPRERMMKEGVAGWK